MRTIICNSITKSKSPVSQAIKAGDLLFVSGQIYRGKALENPTVADETRVVMENLGAILREESLTFNDVCKVNVYLTDISKANEFNSVYKEYFNSFYPTRCCVEVNRLAENAQVEIDLIATINKDD